jgi:hypothetical protein
MTFKTFYTEQLAKGMTLEDIALKHNVDISELEKELAKGSSVELEHEDKKDPNAKENAKDTAMDHLFEDPKYYSKLKAAGIK